MLLKIAIINVSLLMEDDVHSFQEKSDEKKKFFGNIFQDIYQRGCILVLLNYF